MALPGCGELRGPVEGSGQIVRCKKYSGVFSYWGSRLNPRDPIHHNAWVDGKWTGDENACAPCLDGKYKICHHNNERNCYRTKDEEALCGHCKGSSFVSGTGNSTYYALCAKPV